MVVSAAVDFFNQINMLYGTITDFCSEDSCPVMSAGPKWVLGPWGNDDCVCLYLCITHLFILSFRYEYHWADGTNIKKPIKCSAPKYIDYLMTWVQDQLDDETLFPSKIGTGAAIFQFHWDTINKMLLLPVFFLIWIKVFILSIYFLCI